MAQTILTTNPQKITVPVNTTDHTIIFDDVMARDVYSCTILIDNISASTVKFNTLGDATTAATPTYTTTDKPILQGYRQVPLHYAGASTTQTFNITIIN